MDSGRHLTENLRAMGEMATPNSKVKGSVEGKCILHFLVGLGWQYVYAR
jgi:hypothetical protein